MMVPGTGASAGGGSRSRGNAGLTDTFTPVSTPGGTLTGYAMVLLVEPV